MLSTMLGTACENYIVLVLNRDQAHLSVGMTLKQGYLLEPLSLPSVNCPPPSHPPSSYRPLRNAYTFTPPSPTTYKPSFIVSELPDLALATFSSPSLLTNCPSPSLHPRHTHPLSIRPPSHYPPPSPADLAPSPPSPLPSSLPPSPPLLLPPTLPPCRYLRRY
ncbi:uncharacterized protein SCHCODRAFT_02590194 [Schizophyllum commune H4-8]|nr:uncharacterized protein SCHCODRAFT_02516636 [Schizophyllum commune H4-8]XP_050197844.1 uncharacterized protein SCHCODRAFT_02590194 [Schizophyllum commune H4-8]KAI5886844.1 hypothetical protein SCHCODRAFT_02516636 [Schizophyllum commune H4-8]KAI5886852.1 hypothetical protein SCHCODRAFT_02590194 [Schizophyllum commune H4-8]